MSSSSASDRLLTNNDSTPPRTKRQRDNRKNVFTPRRSRLDPESLEKDSLRGFFVFFWIFLIYYALFTTYQSFQKEGVLIRLNFFYFFSEDALSLIQSDLALIGSCFVSVMIAKIVNTGWIPMTMALFMQHAWQTVWFLSIVGWILIKEWRWVRIFFSQVVGTL